MTVKEARTLAGWTQQRLSDELNIPKRTIENWEGEKRKCPEWAEQLIVQEILRRTGKEE
ncbi:MAG: helix-turn-helix domain-containing protein [Clostridiales bacterium]|nr:helix-turn-helix domain-containing protein [Clostridiales bacterium]